MTAETIKPEIAGEMQAKLIRHAMVDAEMSGKDVATRVGISDTLFWLIAYNRRKGYNHRPKIAEVLGRTEEELFHHSPRLAKKRKKKAKAKRSRVHTASRAA